MACPSSTLLLRWGVALSRDHRCRLALGQRAPCHLPSHGNDSFPWSHRLSLTKRKLSRDRVLARKCWP